MKKQLRGAVIATISVAMALGAANAADISLHVDEGCSGPALSTTRSTADVNYPVSSVKIVSGEWEVCRSTNYGNCVPVRSNGCFNLADLHIYGQVRSVRLIEAATSAAEAIIYRDRGFSGPAVFLDDPKPNMNDMGFEIQSVRVKSGSWELCQRPNFENCKIINDSVEDIRKVGVRSLASLRPVAGGAGGAKGEAAFHVRRGCDGPAYDTTVAVPDLNYPVRSVRVRAGEWQVCNGTDFGGTCKVVEKPGCYELGEIGFWGQVRSARPFGYVRPQPR